MANVSLQPESIVITITGTAMLTYAARYREAARVLSATQSQKPVFDPVPYQLLCLSLEQQLKAFIWLKERVGKRTMKFDFGHDLVKLWEYSKSKGLRKYASPTELRNRVIGLVGPYYKERKLTYLDLEMIDGGIRALKNESRVLPTLDRLTEQLGNALHQPVYAAAVE